MSTLNSPQMDGRYKGDAGDANAKYEFCSQTVINMYKYPTFSEAKMYTKRAKNGFSSFTDDADWRAIRAHHNPFNNEDGDMNFFILPFTIDTVVYDFMGLMKSKKVKLIIASHTHNAQFSMINLAAFDKVKDTQKFYVFGKGDSYVGLDCFHHDLTKTTYDFKTTCKDTYAPTIDTKKGDIDNIHIFVVGNSGREFDALRDGKKSLATFVWGRAIGKPTDKAAAVADMKFGGANFEFTKEKVIASFFEISGTVATITIQNAVNSVDYPLLKTIADRPVRRRVSRRMK